MSNPLFLQNTAAKLVVYLTDTASVPATTLTFADVSCSLKKTSGSFNVFTLTALNFTNQGDGFYEVTLDATDTDVLGVLYLWFSGVSIKSCLTSANVVVASALVVSPSPIYTPTTAAIYGSIFTPAGLPSAGVSVSFSLVAKPAVMPPGYLLTSSFLTTSTDSTGLFTIDLLVGGTYEVVIPDADYRRVFTVIESTSLMDMP